MAGGRGGRRHDVVVVKMSEGCSSLLVTPSASHTLTHAPRLSSITTCPTVSPPPYSQLSD